MSIIQRPLTPHLDLRDMLRGYIIKRSLAGMAFSRHRRAEALKSGHLTSYRDAIKKHCMVFIGYCLWIRYECCCDIHQASYHRMYYYLPSLSKKSFC